MRIRSAATAAVAVLGLSVLSACGQTSPAEPGSTGTDGTGTAASSTGSSTAAPDPAADVKALAGVTATGPVDFKTAPKVELGPTPISTTTVQRKVLTPGTGPAATKQDTVRVRVQIYHGTSGKLLDDGFGKNRRDEGYRLGRADLIPGFTEGLVGAQKGSRVAFTIPPAKGFGDSGNAQLGVTATDTLVVIADVSDVHRGLTVLEGKGAASPKGLPTVEFPDGNAKAPKLTIPQGAAPAETQQATLIEGDGPVVEANQFITAHYHGALWKDGSVFDSSWNRGTPADFLIGAGQVIPGWDKVLVGKKVGSRVLIVIPPKDGYGEQGNPNGGITGTDTLVFVVDILDAY
ncbi:FKBP-type peptidyl-prolyl cis-trans isomerase [Intrasporangium sp.]|uniref:FKBP-type peptidyl-prolyl cis-trans isomerase n=1 Tax=Intrasporangium sp. TaxID=1925024 RepID=UPI00293B4354|nr:FKBP-type peptidyl-prolyl cis-trans isomerase [Intrasporangium sp.]MDV3222112.1 FKBP-type peptidyl-prolyl cis-trans isomerase [Intrasporangium sp.]